MKKILLVVNGEKDWQDFLPDEKIKKTPTLRSVGADLNTMNHF